MNIKSIRIALMVVFLTTIALNVESAVARDRPSTPAVPTITGDITFILAARQPERIDRRLLPLKRDLQKAFSPRFKRFEYIEASYPRLSQNRPKVISLPGGGKMKVTYLGRTGKFIQMKLELPEWTGKVRAKDGKRFFQAGRKYRDGILVISIRMHSTR